LVISVEVAVRLGTSHKEGFTDSSILIFFTGQLHYLPMNNKEPAKFAGSLTFRICLVEVN